MKKINYSAKRHFSVNHPVKVLRMKLSNIKTSFNYTKP